jgi:myo-inositol-1(or 4)-monophosphatase
MRRLCAWKGLPLRVIEADVAPAAHADLLVLAVREAGALALSMFGAPVKNWIKGKGSPVCEADIAADRLLRERLTGPTPSYGWLSEESIDAPARLVRRRVWIVDPIDGTRGFLAGHPDWAVSAALVEDGRPVVAALFAPATDEMFLAIKSRGATRNGHPIQVSPGERLAGARLAGPQRRLERLAAAVPGTTMVPKIHSLALRIARVADGTLDAALAGPNSHDWDLAAADLLVHEAGGALTAPDGAPPVYNRPEPVHGVLIAAGAARHAAMLALVRDRGADFALIG